ncbi:hypothetical protein ACGFSI_41735 [Streptomyces virginiae]|uniref:hypothetical protein n=1 Tax=Streptomyces virginiae TaxID=1961 RepID=UPI003716C37F
MSSGAIERAADAEVIEGVIVPAAADGVTAYDPEMVAALRVLHALEDDANDHLEDIRPRKTRTGYARDWVVWQDFHDHLAEETGMRLPDGAVTKGTLVKFVRWLDERLEAAPATIGRRITGITVEARVRGIEVSADATKAARAVLKTITLDREKVKRARGKATAATPAHLRIMATAGTVVPKAEGSRRRRAVYELPELARLRDRALAAVAFGIGGRSAEVSLLDVDGIRQTAEGLEVHVPSVKRRPARDVVVAYGESADSCPVRCWLAWKEAAGITSGPAFLPVDQWGHLGTGRLSPDSCRKVITRAAERAGVGVRLTGHSMRSGLVTTSRKAGKRVEKIMEQTGHSPKSAEFWGYIRDAEKWDDAATDGIGL